MATIVAIVTFLSAEKATIKLLKKGYDIISQKAGEAKENRAKCKALAAKCIKLSNALDIVGSTNLIVEEAEDLKKHQIEVLQFVDKFKGDTAKWKNFKKEFKNFVESTAIQAQFVDLEKKLEETQSMMLFKIEIAIYKGVKQIGGTVEDTGKKVEQIENKANENGENIKQNGEKLDELMMKLNELSSKDRNDDRAKGYRNMLQKQASVDIINAAQAMVAGDKHAEERELRKVIKNNPKSRTAWFNLGLLLDIQEDVDGAEDAYRNALAIDPKYASAWNNLGLLLMNYKKDLDGAEVAYRKALAIDPKDAVVWHNLGCLFCHQEDYVGAEVAYRKALAIDPKDASTWNNFGMLLHNHKEDFDDAEDAYNKALSIDPKNAGVLYNLGRLHYDQEDYVGAEAAYREALAIDPKDADTWYNLGDLLADHKNDISGARKSYKKVLKIDPNYEEAVWIRNWLNENPKPESKKKKKRQTK